MRYLSALLLFAVASSAADRIVGGPYVVNPAARSATIGWVVETDTVSVKSPQAERRIPLLRSEKISITGLKAGEPVEYEIPGDGPVESRRGFFKMPPTDPVPFQFTVFGDT